MYSIVDRIEIIKKDMYDKIYGNVNYIYLIDFRPDEDEKSIHSSKINFKSVYDTVKRTNSYLEVYEYIKERQDFVVQFSSRNSLRTSSVFAFVNKIANHLAGQPEQVRIQIDYLKIITQYSIHLCKLTKGQDGIGIYFKYKNSNKDCSILK